MYINFAGQFLESEYGIRAFRSQLFDEISKSSPRRGPAESYLFYTAVSWILLGQFINKSLSSPFFATLPKYSFYRNQDGAQLIGNQAKILKSDMGKMHVSVKLDTLFENNVYIYCIAFFPFWVLFPTNGKFHH